MNGNFYDNTTGRMIPLCTATTMTLDTMKTTMSALRMIMAERAFQ